MKLSISTNNFDLLRLLAASQVVAHHGIDHLHLDRASPFVSLLTVVIKFFPGVPVFFFISGFLISKSYETSSSVGAYTRNRVLRIYPALVVCTLLSVATVFALGYLPRSGASPTSIVAWMLGQMSVVQFFNPAFMREFGVGVLNGSLWTIPVELQFYVAIPILYALLGLKARTGTAMSTSLIVLFSAANLLYWQADPDNHPSIALELFGVSFVPWIFMFLVGVMAQRHVERLHGWLAGRALLVGVVYVAVSAVAHRFEWRVSNDIHPLMFLLLCAFVFSLAFTCPNLAERILRHNDISYGIYIYHMPCINALLYLGLGGQTLSLGLACVVTLSLAVLSWIFVERPALALKRGGIRHAATATAQASAVP